MKTSVPPPRAAEGEGSKPLPSKSGCRHKGGRWELLNGSSWVKANLTTLRVAFVAGDIDSVEMRYCRGNGHGVFGNPRDLVWVHTNGSVCDHGNEGVTILVRGMERTICNRASIVVLREASA